MTKERPLNLLPDGEPVGDLQMVTWSGWLKWVHGYQDHFMRLVADRGTYNVWAPQPESSTPPTVGGLSIMENFDNFIAKKNHAGVLNYLQNTRLHLSGDHTFSKSWSCNTLTRLIMNGHGLWVRDGEENKKMPRLYHTM